MQTRMATPAALTKLTILYQVPLLLVVTAPAYAQQAPVPNAPPTSVSLETIMPRLPPSVVPPRIAAPNVCAFPHSAIYEHPTGPAILAFTVTAQGHVTDISIRQSSGSGRVDEAARECVAEWVYAPAIHDGAPVAVSWATEVNFTVTTRNGQPALPPDAPQGTEFVRMPVQKRHPPDAPMVSCEEWHRDAARGVLVAFDVEPDGSVKNAAVADSSGDPAIDKDAVDCISHRNYKPATRDGEPVEFRLTAELFGGN